MLFPGPPLRPFACAILLLMPLASGGQEGSSGDVLTLDAAMEKGESFLELLGEGDAAAMYQRLDAFSRLRWREEDFADNIRRLLDQYGPIRSIALSESRDGDPFFHGAFEVAHRKSTLEYEITVGIGGQILRFEVVAVDGQKLEPAQP